MSRATSCPAAGARAARHLRRRAGAPPRAERRRRHARRAATSMSRRELPFAEVVAARRSTLPRRRSRTCTTAASARSTSAPSPTPIAAGRRARRVARGADRPARAVFGEIDAGASRAAFDARVAGRRVGAGLAARLRTTRAARACTRAGTASRSGRAPTCCSSPTRTLPTAATQLDAWTADVPIVAMTESWRGLPRLRRTGGWRRMDAFPADGGGPDGRRRHLRDGIPDTIARDRRRRRGRAVRRGGGEPLGRRHRGATAMPDSRARSRQRMRAHPEVALR